MREIRCDLCVIGAGSGGLSVAAGAAQMGADTVLIERGAMGGDCLNTGCVPSKTLLAAAKRGPVADFAEVHARVRGVIASIAPHDSQERFEGLGVRVLRETARFVGPDAVEAGDVRVRARRFVLATGSRAAVPPLPGLDAVPFLTNETLFERTALPAHLLVLGGGPIGVEMAQAFRRLDARVTVVEKAALLPKDDPELAEVVRRRLAAEGVEVIEGTGAAGVERVGEGVVVTLDDGRRVEGSDLLVAAGRVPNVEGMGLEAAGIAFGKKGVEVDARLRTTNRRVFAVGDVTGGPAFTHVAGQHASVVIRNALFRLPAKVDYGALPWVTYTDPELAQVGMTEAAARERFGDRVRVLRAPFAENDRARTEGETEGLVKLVVGRRGRVLGAGIVGASAGEQIALWCLVVAKRMSVGDVAGLTLPYPTLAEAGKRAAGSFYTPTLFGERTRRLVRFLRWFG